MFPQKLLIITGLSGSGKSSALHVLEDQGFFTVDNLPIAMLPELLGMLSNHPRALENGVGAVIDVRSAELNEGLPKVLDTLKEQSVSVQILFLEASKETLLKRFSFTRRRHPLAFTNSLSEGIELEAKQLKQFRKYATRVIDTSNLSAAQLRAEIFEILARNPAGIEVTVTSFGYRHGSVPDADYILDVRFLVNPYYVDELRPLSGRDEAIQKYISGDRMTGIFLNQTLELFENIIPVYHLSGKNYMHIAVGCTGGRHRSVFAAEWLGERLGRIEGVSCQVRHRDITRNEHGAAQ